MAKARTVYVCSDCGQESQKWVGRCPACGQWNTMKEFRIAADAGRRSVGAGHVAATSTVGTAGRKGSVRLRDVSVEAQPRIDMCDAELNRVLGGGLVPGSLVLLGGEPGIGKSTLLLQTALHLSRRVLYVSGEESEQQIKLRAARIDASSRQEAAAVMHGGQELLLFCETNLERIFDEVAQVQPELLVVDSIQTLFTETLDSTAGSITQIRECATALLKYAKESGTPIVLVGHITKDGAIAGPKVLEHIVDTVLQFEGDRHYFYRLLRSQKNRFGSTSELGIYEMRQEGLRPVSNPSELLLTQGNDDLSGVAICAAIEGVRPFLIEVQALVSSAAYGTPQRSATGFDLRRLNMLLAVLEKRVGFKIGAKDVFLNIAGGLRVTDTATDLSVIAAVLSSNVDTPIERSVAMAGEVGLSGEIRPVTRIHQRIGEAEKLGFARFVLPEANLKGLDRSAIRIGLVPVRSVTEALQALFG